MQLRIGSLIIQIEISFLNKCIAIRISQIAIRILNSHDILVFYGKNFFNLSIVAIR